MSTAVINIDTDAKCKRCGKSGTLPNGFCMDCVADGVKAGLFDDVIKEAKNAASKSTFQGAEMSKSQGTLKDDSTLDELIESKMLVENLPCTLTVEESHNYAKTCARLIRELETVEDEKKVSTSEFKERIDSINARSRMLSEYVNSNQQFRDVDVRQEFDFSLGAVRKIRVDTGEVIETRAMTNEESQRAMNLS